MDTWIFFRGRWKIIGARGLLQLVIVLGATAWITGAVCGAVFTKVAYEARIAIFQRRLDAIQSEVDQVENDFRRAQPLLK